LLTKARSVTVVGKALTTLPRWAYLECRRPNA
jgi:hypothetical protein